MAWLGGHFTSSIVKLKKRVYNPSISQTKGRGLVCEQGLMKTRRCKNPWIEELDGGQVVHKARTEIQSFIFCKRHNFVNLKGLNASDIADKTDLTQ